MQINRNSSIVQQILTAYACNSLHSLEMKVKFVSELGHDGGGLRRELVGCFWDEFACKHMEGSVEKIPTVGPAHGIDYYHVGRFISHTYSYWLLSCLSRVFSKARTRGINSIADDDLLSSSTISWTHLKQTLLEIVQQGAIVLHFNKL